MKVLLFAGLLILIVVVQRTFYFGRRLAGRSSFTSKIQNKKTHKWFARITLWVMIIAVLLIEAWIRFTPHQAKKDWVFYTHLSGAVVFLTCLVMLLTRFNGNRSKQHKGIAYISLVAFIVIVATAIPMILRI